MPPTLNLVNASVGKRAGAKLIDAVPVLIVSGIGMLLAFGQLAGTTTPGEMLTALTSLVLFNSIASLLCLAYWIWLWGWEATRGNSIGNALLGIRTTSLEGFRPGWGAIFVRGLVIWLGSLVLLVGAVIVLISNLWDPNGRKQGWHDKAARAYVFDIRAGRNPMATGGVSGPDTFAPAPLPAAMQAAAPPMEAEPSTPAAAPSPAHGARQRTATKDPHEQTTGPGPEAPKVTQPMGGPVISSVPGVDPEPPADSRTDDAGQTRGQADGALPGARAATEPAVAPHPDDDVEATRITSRAAKPQVRLVFDDGRELELRSAALIGRNPAGRAEEVVDQLIDVSDQGRSVSKTHLHLRVEVSAIWVTDRNSTNGSAISTPDGTRTELRPGEAVRAEPGTTVHFGDRSFLVGTA